MKAVEELTQKFRLDRKKLKENYEKHKKDNSTSEKLITSLKLPDDYLMRNESRLTLYDGAVSVLEKHGINPDDISLEQLKKDLENLEEKRNSIKNENVLLTPKIKELQLQLNNLTDYLQFNKSQEIKETQKGQEH